MVRPFFGFVNFRNQNKISENFSFSCNCLDKLHFGESAVKETSFTKICKFVWYRYIPFVDSCTIVDWANKNYRNHSFGKNFTLLNLRYAESLHIHRANFICVLLPACVGQQGCVGGWAAAPHLRVQRGPEPGADPAWYPPAGQATAHAQPGRLLGHPRATLWSGHQHDFPLWWVFFHSPPGKIVYWYIVS